MRNGRIRDGIEQRLNLSLAGTARLRQTLPLRKQGYGVRKRRSLTHKWPRTTVTSLRASFASMQLFSKRRTSIRKQSAY